MIYRLRTGMRGLDIVTTDLRDVVALAERVPVEVETVADGSALVSAFIARQHVRLTRDGLRVLEHYGRI
jgi:hypothetical protein